MTTIAGRDALTALDATFLELEQADDGAHMHIGGALVFAALPGGSQPSVEAIREHLGARLHLLPRYRQRLSAPRVGGLSWPTWEEDPRFDITSHVRATRLPEPGGDDLLLEWISDFYSHRLDRRRPLWEMVLVSGLAQDRWALCWKTHHCLVDGVGSVDVAHLLLDAEPDAGPPPVAAQEAHGGSGEVLASWLPRPPEALRQAAGAGLRAASGGVHALLHPRATLERSARVVDLLVRDELVAAPATSLNSPIGATRRMEAVHVPLADLKAIKDRLGGKVNDVVLAACTAGLREVLLERGERPPAAGLRAMVPVNIRTAAEHGVLGNKIASLFVHLPVALADPRERYDRVVQETTRLKSSGQAAGAGELTELTALAPPVMHASLARALFAKRLFNVTITNVPGPQQRLYALGAPMIDVIPLVPLAADHEVGIAILSYAGTLTFGIAADHDGVPELDTLAFAILREIDDLSRLAQKEGRRS